jgi:hypothetical protein
MFNRLRMTPAERAKGRFMRAPDGHESDDLGIGNGGQGGQQSQQGSGDNSGVTNGDSDDGTGDQNNNGQPADFSGFWKEPEAPDTSGSDSQNEEGVAVGRQLASMIEGASFGNGVFTKEILEQIAEGNVEGVNTAIAKSNQEVIRQAIPVFGKLMEAVVSRQAREFDARIQQILQGDKQTAKLEEQFPEAKDPAVRPIVQRVYDQALSNNKGNIDKAISDTKGMLKAFGVKVGLTQAPADPSGNNSASQSLVEELLGRSG